MKAFEFTTLIKANVPTKLGLFSDIHWDSPDCDIKITTRPQAILGNTISAKLIAKSR